MKELACLFLCLFLWNCCPICGSDCFYTIEKSVDVDAVEKYRDVDYYLNYRWYDFVDDTLQEMYYKWFCVYIDSANVYNLSMPVSVNAYPEPASRLKLVVTKDGKETVFEFDIVQKAYKSRHSRKWMSFISF